MDDTGFHDLLRRAQAGDRPALDHVLALLRPHLEQLARRYADPARGRASASDLVQEAWLRAWQKLEQFQGGADDAETLALFRAWVGQIVRRVGLNAQRHQQTQRRRPAQGIVRLGTPGTGDSTNEACNPEPPDREPTPSTNVRTDEQTRLIQTALEKIPDENGRAILRLRFFDDLSLRQIAERLGLSYDQVRARYQVALQRLERELGPLL
jgi:RNA polymerase sigma factor (sigma-70 family)